MSAAAKRARELLCELDSDSDSDQPARLSLALKRELDAGPFARPSSPSLATRRAVSAQEASAAQTNKVGLDSQDHPCAHTLTTIAIL